ncbi:phage major capsid protein [uncultured Mitsuokella sp.]|uniref:phage major capsid protein n=1 Tax=uncultured Mitsuokella sp. TaxID=453120 RepID=UPI00259227AD|nr:phage major capsid protein [uncultured Mitsuokella sp.]
MDTKKILKIIRDKEARKKELVERSEKATTVEELRSINEDIKHINAEIKDLEELRATVTTDEQSGDIAERTKAINGRGHAAEPEARGKQLDDPEHGFELRGRVDLDGDESKEARNREYGKNLKKEGRSVKLAGGSIVLPQYTGDTINPSFLQSSNLIDLVKQVPIMGGETYKQPYEISTGDAGYTGEGEAAAEAEVKFGQATIAKAKVTAYSEMTDEVEKLAEAPYAEIVLGAIRTSLRKKLAKEILVGTGDDNTLTGIFSSKAAAIDADKDLTIAKIDNTTLDSIVYGYGGDESVEGRNILILNKKDLAAFARLRNTDGSKFHTIVMSGNGGSGTIDGTPFVINSACGSIADSKTSEGAYCMAYGNPMNYQLTIFSDPEITKSTDYKFRELITCHRGVIFAGGNVVSANGFIRVKKASQA